MSDRLRSIPDVRWRMTGVGMPGNFRCMHCRQDRPCMGRRMRLFRGARVWFCAHCAKDKP